MTGPTIDDYYAHVLTDIVPTARLRGALGKFSYNNLKIKSVLTYGVDERGYVFDVLVTVSSRLFPKKTFYKSRVQSILYVYPMLSLLELESGVYGLTISSTFELSLDRAGDVSELEIVMDELLYKYLEFDREFKSRSSTDYWNPISND
jgi:hypothetical protein